MTLRPRTWSAWAVLALVPLAGCVSGSKRAPVPSIAKPQTVEVITPLSQPARAPELRQANFEQPAATIHDADPFAGEAELTAERLVAAVLARNPTIAQMTAAAEAAAARYPQVTSLDDPMFGANIGPASIGARDVDFAYRLEASQRLPYPGKRALRGANAQAEARAAADEVEDARLTLTESARSAFADYFLAERALEVNRENLDLLQDFRKDVQARFTRGLVPEQDQLLTDVEIARQQERRLTLERLREVAAARLNTLMHRPPDAKLPAPPRALTPTGPVPEAKALRDLAAARRPDLRALVNRVEAESAALALAEREYKPDFEVMAAYDAFWQKPEEALRPMVGLRMNVPVRHARRHGAVAEAAARLAQRRAEYARLADQVNYEVQQAAAQLRESRQTLELFETTTLPVSRRSVQAARTAYTAAKLPALSVVEAQRTLVGQRERAYEALADYFRRLAALERATGGPLPEPAREQLPPPKPLAEMP